MKTNHPAWCGGEHAPTWPVHTAEIGDVRISESLTFEVYVRQWKPDATPVVNVMQVSADDVTVIDLDPHAALQLARRLTEAAQIATGTWAPLTDGSAE